MIVVVDNYMGYLVIETSAPGPTDSDILIMPVTRDRVTTWASSLHSRNLVPKKPNHL